MTRLLPAKTRDGSRHPRDLSSRCRARPARGVVLVVALVLLVVISLLALTSLRNAGSAESVAGNTRTTELATQAAEIALRHCEASVLANTNTAAGGVSTYVTSFSSSNILPPSTPPHWQNMALWDSNSTAVFVLPLLLLNQPGMTYATYQRAPECMVEQIPSASSTSTATFFVITVRGFGPEVVALTGPARIRPVGSEIWLQSDIKMDAQ